MVQKSIACRRCCCLNHLVLSITMECGSVVYLLINPDTPVLAVGGIDLCTAVLAGLTVRWGCNNDWYFISFFDKFMSQSEPRGQLCEWLVCTGTLHSLSISTAPISCNHWRILLEICSLYFMGSVLYIISYCNLNVIRSGLWSLVNSCVWSLRVV